MPEDLSTVVRIDIPPDHHPDTLRGDGPGIQAGHEALGVLYDAYGKINDAARAVQDKGRLASRAQPFAENAIHRADALLARLGKMRDHLNETIVAAITPAQVPNERSDIRAYWRGQSEPFAKIAALARAGDLATISAVLSGPAYLSGLTDEQQAVIRAEAGRAVAPDQTKELADTEAAIARVERALGHFADTMATNIRDWRDDDHKHLEKLA